MDLQVNQELRVDVEMAVELGVIVVEDLMAAPSDLKKDSASLGAVIENRQVEGLPLDGRNFYELSLLVPGAAPRRARLGRVGARRLRLQRQRRARGLEQLPARRRLQR